MATSPFAPPYASFPLPRRPLLFKSQTHTLSSPPPQNPTTSSPSTDAMAPPPSRGSIIGKLSLRDDHPDWLANPVLIKNCSSCRARAVGGPMLNMIFQAASDGDLPLLKRRVMMLDMGRGRLKEAVEALRVEDVGMLEGHGVLHVAACRGRLQVCRYLIEELGLDVNGVDKGGRTPLLFAISCKGLGIAKYLLDHGANPDKASHNGLSPLHPAAGSGDCEMVELLLAKGAYVDPIAFCGTPLHCAATEGHDGTMKILLDHNADARRCGYE